MKKVIVLAAALLFSSPATAVTLNWTRGWDAFNEPLGGGGVQYAVSGKTLVAIFSVVGAKPNKMYQVGVHLQCTTLTRFGQFPFANGSACSSITREGQTRSIQAPEFAVMTTDASGAGSVRVDVGPLSAGVYKLHFNARVGAGCNIALGPTQGPSSTNCNAVFRAPAPFGNFATIRIQ